MLILLFALICQPNLDVIQNPYRIEIKTNIIEYSDSIWKEAVKQQRGLLIGKNVELDYMISKAEKENKLWCITELPNFSDGVTEYPLPKTLEQKRVISSVKPLKIQPIQIDYNYVPQSMNYCPNCQR